MPEFNPQFEAVFDALIPEEAETSGALAAPPPLLPEVERAVQRALALFSEGLYVRCWDLLDGVGSQAAADARATALGAARLAFETGRPVPGIQTCLGLLEGRDHLPDLYLVLGVLLLKTKQRAQAYEAFRQGLHLAPAHGGLQLRLEAMGRRQPPPLPFLPRSHRVNRLLGRLRSWLSTLQDVRALH